MRRLLVNLSISDWSDLLRQVKQFDLLLSGLKRMNAYFSIKKEPGQSTRGAEEYVERWLTGQVDSSRAIFRPDAGAVDRQNCLGVVESAGDGKLRCIGVGGEDKLITLADLGNMIVPSFSMRNVISDWDAQNFGESLSGDVWLYVQDRYLFKRDWRDALFILFDHIGLRLSSEVNSVNIIFVTEEFHVDNPIDSLEDFIVEATEGWRVDPVVNWFVYVLAANRADDGGLTNADYHCRYLIWPDLTFQFARGIAHRHGDLWVRCWSHYSLVDDVELSDEQLKRFRNQLSDKKFWLRNIKKPGASMSLRAWGIKS